MILMILILAFISAGSLTTWTGEQLQVQVTLIRTLNNGTFVHQVAFSPDGRYLASAGWDGTIKQWEVATGREIGTFNGPKPAYSVAFSPDGHLIASGSTGQAVVWEVATGKILYTVSGVTYTEAPVTGTAFSSDGRYLATASWDKKVRLWEITTGRYIRTLQGHTGEVYAIAFSPDGESLASAAGDRTVILWTVDSGRAIRTLHGHTGVVHTVAFSPDGKTLASGAWDNTIRLWDTSSGKELRTLLGHGGYVWEVAFSPDGEWIASASCDRTAKLWETATGLELYTFSGHTDEVRSVAFSSNGRYLATGSWDSTIKLWEIQTVENQTPQARFTFSPSKPIVGQSVRFDASSSSDPDGTITGYAWDFGDSSTGLGKITTHSYNRSGSFTVTLTVTDDDGAADSTSKTITIIKANESPRAEFTFSPKEPTDLDTIQFTDKSTDPDGRIVKWHWDFGDNSISTKQNPYHRYQDDGTYTVKLAVTDDDGATDTTFQEITVWNVPPKADFTFAPSQPIVDQPVTFDASTSSDPDGSITKYEWDFGDGASAERVRVTHTFPVEGTYKIKLTVTDSDGASDSVEQEVKVLESGGGGGPA